MLESLKGANKTVGVKQSLKAVENDTVRLIFIARDADERVIGSVKQLASQKAIPIQYVETMKQLGKACSIEVGAAIVCLLK